LLTTVSPQSMLSRWIDSHPARFRIDAFFNGLLGPYDPPLPQPAFEIAEVLRPWRGPETLLFRVQSVLWYLLRRNEENGLYGLTGGVAAARCRPLRGGSSARLVGASVDQASLAGRPGSPGARRRLVEICSYV
jgi:hypothetical protein